MDLFPFSLQSHMSGIFAFHATTMANTLATPIIVFTRTGSMAILLSHYRPSSTIFAFTNVWVQQETWTWMRCSFKISWFWYLVVTWIMSFYLVSDVNIVAWLCQNLSHIILQNGLGSRSQSSLPARALNRRTQELYLFGRFSKNAFTLSLSHTHGHYVT